MLPYCLAIFTGAFLLFQVQPLIGKYILPWFGGGPGVWTACLLFFQVMLLGGYAYAHFLTRQLALRRQVLVHLGLLLAALLLLPIVPSESWKPRGAGNPALQILALLAACLGLPYFALSATGPLLQHWFSRSRPGASPYRLYALSNAGSLLALLSYPFYFESHFARKTQASLWGWGLLAYALCCAWCGRRVWQARPLDNASGAPAAPAASPAAAPSAIRYLLWLLLPACGSVLLLATTNKLCLDVAVFPFLWVVPLALYLLSFIICFDHARWYHRLPSAVLLLASAGGVCWALSHGAGWPLWKQVLIYAGGLFLCCLVCHGELYRLRPAPERLTGYYLLIAAGGALGGLLVAVVAPLAFRNYYELHWGWLLCAALLALVQSAEVAGLLPPRSIRFPWPALSGFRHWRLVGCAGLWLGTVLLGIALFRHVSKPDPEIVYTGRNFYGVLTVYEYRRSEPDGHYFLLQHGRITHGLQFVDRAQARWPTSYYGPHSGVGLALDALPGQRRLGLVGLGSGTLTAYARPGDTTRIYEINPEVKRLATTYFNYLSNCAGRVEVVLGDARLSLEREASQQFDLLALDAFSSDAIPVHLLTREAFDLYARHLKTNGVLAVHISNHFLDLEPVVVNLARHFHYQYAVIDYDETDDEWWCYSSTWMLLSHNPAFFSLPSIASAAAPAKTNLTRVPLWTDDFASLYQILER